MSVKFSDSVKYIGVDDTTIDLFESQYVVPKGVSYNSYVILDEKIAVMDTVDANFTHEWLDNLDRILEGRKPDYLIVQHMEPDHAAELADLLRDYPRTQVLCSAMAKTMIGQFFGPELAGRITVIKEGETLSTGRHTLHFVAAPMVHWPEVMVSYESSEKVLFSADGFGRFGAVAKFDEKIGRAHV